MSKSVWARALVTVALREPARALLLASAAGWIAFAWLLTGDPLPHAHSRSQSQLPHFMAMWSAMILAMAPPLLLREIGRLWRTSLRRVRVLTIASFLSGYVSIWLLAGLALSTLFGWVTVSAERIAAQVTLVALVALVALIAMVVVWHCSPARQRCLNACHRVPSLRVFGIAALWDSLRYGVSTGCYCVAACGLVMLLVLLVRDHHLAAMALTAAVMTLERHLPARRPRWQLPILRNRSLDWPGYAEPTTA